MKKSIVLFLLISITATIWYFLSEDKIKIGVLISTDVPIGNEQVLSLKYATSKYTKVGNYKIEYVFKTPTYNKQEIKKAYYELLKEEVSIIIGPALSGEVKYIFDDINKNNIPVISPTASSHEFVAKKDNFFKVITTTKLQSSALTDYIIGLNKKRVSLLLSNSNRAYSDSFAYSFQKSFEKEDVQTIHVTDIQEAVKRVIEYSPDVIVFCIQSNELIQLLKPIKDKFPNIVYTSSTWGYQQLLVDFAGPILDDIAIATEFSEPSSEYLKYAKELSSIYKMKPSFASGVSFSSLKIALEAIKEVGSDPRAIVEYLSTPREYEYAYGKIKIDEYGDAHVKNFKIIIINHGKTKIVKTIQSEF